MQCKKKKEEIFALFFEKEEGVNVILLSICRLKRLRIGADIPSGAPSSPSARQQPVPTSNHQPPLEETKRRRERTPELFGPIGCCARRKGSPLGKR